MHDLASREISLISPEIGRERNDVGPGKCALPEVTDIQDRILRMQLGKDERQRRNKRESEEEVDPPGPIAR